MDADQDIDAGEDIEADDGEDIEEAEGGDEGLLPDDDQGDGEELEDQDAEPETLEGDEWEGVSARTHTAKVNGEDVTRTVAEWVKAAQKGDGAEARFEEAARLRKDAEGKAEETEGQLVEVKDFFREMSTPEGLIGAMRSLGPVYQRAFQEAAEQTIYDRLEDEKMTPEQRRVRGLEREVRQRRQGEQTAAQQRKQAEDQHQRQEHQRHQQAIAVFHETVGAAVTAAGFEAESDAADEGRALVLSAVRRLVKGENRAATDTEIRSFAEAARTRLGVAPPPAAKSKKRRIPPSIKSGAGASKRGRRSRTQRKSMASFFDDLEADVGDADDYRDDAY